MYYFLSVGHFLSVSKGRQKIHYLVPSIMNGVRGFPQLIVKEIPGKNRGVVAAVNIPRHCCIPILGIAICPCDNISKQKEEEWTTKDLIDKLSEIGDPRVKYLVEVSSTTVICCYPPDCLEGLAISGLLNEPSIGESPNCALYKGFTITLSDVPCGAELLWYYGPHYARDYRISKGRGKHLTFKLPISRIDYKRMWNITEMHLCGHDGITDFLKMK